MAINVKSLQPSHIVSTETRDRIHDLTDDSTGKRGAHTMGQRAQFASARGLRNVTKYWPVEAVLEFCDLFEIEPVLGKGGAEFVRRNGGLSYSKGGIVAKVDQYAKPAVFVGQPKQDPNEPVWTPVEPAKPVANTATESDGERQRKLQALRDLVRQEVQAQVGQDEEIVKELVATTAAASAGAAVDTIGKRLLSQLKAEADARLQVALDRIDEAREVEIVVRSPLGTQKVTGHIHACFNYVLFLASQRENIALIGPTGCGKTHLAEQVAQALGLSYATVSVTMGMSETKIIGGLLPLGDHGKFEYYVAAFVQKFRDGGVFLADEFDAVDPNVALVINAALANGHIDLPIIGCVKRHPDFVMMIAMNTYGTGADFQYVGRSALDEASLDRFRNGQLTLDYDRKMERDVMLAGVTDAKERQMLEAWIKRCWDVRDRINGKLRRNMSTRFILQAAKLLRAGCTPEKRLSAYTTGWTAAELQTAGITRVPLY